MILLNKIMVDISLARHSKIENLIENIRDIGHQINLGSSIALIADLKMNWTFKDKAKKEEASVTDLVLLVLWLLREDI